MKVTHIVVHYTATYGDDDITVADVDKMHRARGWQMIGYHWFIRRDGTVEQGRPETMVGAHVGGQNTGKIGISWAGGLDRATGPNHGVDNRTPAQTDALTRLIRDCLKRYPGAKVVGHRDLAPTQCPGFDVQSWWAKVQKKGAPAPVAPPPAAKVKTPGVGEDATHVVQKGETWWSIAQMHGLAVADLARANGSSVTDTLVVGRTLTLVISKERVEVEKPTVPEAVETKTKERVDWWTKLTGGGGLGALGLGGIFGMDWQAVVAGGVILIVVILILVLLRRQLVGAVRDIKQAVEG